MAEQLLVDLIETARENNDEKVIVIITPKAEDAPSYVGTIDVQQSNSKMLSLLPVATSTEHPEGGPTYRFPRACVRHVASAGEADGEPLFWFIIDGNHSLSGVRITSDEFYKMNDQKNGGNWPAGFTHDDPNVYIYLKLVTFDGGVVSRAITFNMDEINCCGDVW
ncbi:MAG: hypothetical protein R3A46_03975 [Thermomicrobiales bacterium]